MCPPSLSISLSWFSGISRTCVNNSTISSSSSMLLNKVLVKPSYNINSAIFSLGKTLGSNAWGFVFNKQPDSQYSCVVFIFYFS